MMLPLAFLTVIVVWKLGTACNDDATV